MHAKIRMAFFVSDSHFLRTYGMGMVLPWPYYVSNLIRRRYFIKASTLDELARNIKVDARALHHTVESCNEYAWTGYDEFNRGGNNYDNLAVKPNPKLTSGRVGRRRSALRMDISRKRKHNVGSCDKQRCVSHRPEWRTHFRVICSWLRFKIQSFGFATLEDRASDRE
jgi:hypothetical protein